MPIPSIPPLSPLSALYLPDPVYDFSYLTYPLDFDHISTQGHYMNFYINVHKQSKYYSGNQYTYTPAPGAGGGSYHAVDNNPAGGNVVGGPNGVSLGAFVNQRINQAISLYIPDSVGFQHSIEWGSASVADMGKTAIKKILNSNSAAATKSQSQNIIQGYFKRALTTLGSAVLTPDTQNLIKDTAGVLGLALNPQLLVLFRGINFRTFQFDFIFTPHSEDEAVAIRNIVKAFRFHAYPEDAFDLGIFYIAPSTFDIEFMYKGARNTNVFQISTCVLTSYFYDAAPYGWSTYVGGMPVQSTLSLVFQETQIITKELVEKGY